jgi:hypothetical protein
LPPQAILVSDWLISKKNFSSVATWPNESKFGRKHPWKVVCKEIKMTNLYRGHAIDAFYQVSVHLAKRFQRKIFFRIDQPEKRIACAAWQMYRNLV